jgi:hypothetical protein
MKRFIIGFAILAMSAWTSRCKNEDDKGSSGGGSSNDGDASAEGEDASKSGKDASYSKTDSGSNPKRNGKYTYNGDGTVTDTSIGLIWTMCQGGKSGNDCSQGSASEYTWLEAIDYCDNLDFAGFDDWRLPEIHELASAVDYTTGVIAFRDVYTGAFSSSLSIFWSSSPSAGSNHYAWTVNFNGSGVSDYGKGSTESSSCVRGKPLVFGSFDASVISNERAVRDKVSGLVWQGCTAGQSGESCDQGSTTNYTWQEAIDYCDNLTWAGDSDWRLPDIYELMSIADYTRSNPTIDAMAFPNTPSAFFWSSSSSLGISDWAREVDFSDGTVDTRSKTSMYSTVATRCVRNGS